MRRTRMRYVVCRRLYLLECRRTASEGVRRTGCAHRELLPLSLEFLPACLCIPPWHPGQLGRTSANGGHRFARITAIKSLQDRHQYHSCPLTPLTDIFAASVVSRISILSIYACTTVLKGPVCRTWECTGSTRHAADPSKVLQYTLWVQLGPNLVQRSDQSPAHHLLPSQLAAHQRSSTSRKPAAPHKKSATLQTC